MPLELLDYRRQVFSHYLQLRSSQEAPEVRLAEFRKRRDELFAYHSQSALSSEQKKGFKGLDYFDYDPQWEKMARLDFDIEHEEFEIGLRDDGSFRMKRLAQAFFIHEKKEYRLSLYWLSGYGGGLFLPFRDESRKSGETYGGSRYLLDTIKGADLGDHQGMLNLDFNYAYNPSCAYHAAWDCPLAPQENWLDTSILAGEKAFPQSETL